MLVLTRKDGESIRIGDNIWVTVEHASGGRIKLSFDAPKEIRILRKELVDRTETAPVNEIF